MSEPERKIPDSIEKPESSRKGKIQRPIEKPSPNPGEKSPGPIDIAKPKR